MTTICKHKFQDHLKLDYVNWDVKTLFIGTFNPGCCEKEENSAEWFYGRTDRNMFWNTLGYIYSNNPRLGDERKPELWMSFCKENKIAVTDLIYEVNELDLSNGEDKNNLCSGFSDKKLENYILQNKVTSSKVENLINNSPKLKNVEFVYLTRRGADNPWNSLWNPIQNICNKREIHISTLTTPGGFNYFQFNNDFPRTPENLANIWYKNDFKM